jgi:transposase
VQHVRRRAGAPPAGHHAQKKALRAAEQDRLDVQAARVAWRAEFAAIDPARLVFLDESGATTTLTRRYGRAPRGVRIEAAVPHGHWKVVTLTAAVRLAGVGACLAFDGATDAACFETYLEACLAPTLRPGEIVVMDNLACHKAAAVERLIQATGAAARYLPPYSPDLNPIEELFSKLKECLRSASARTVGALIRAMGAALRSVTPRDILGWFRHCGYRYEQA